MRTYFLMTDVLSGKSADLIMIYFVLQVNFYANLAGMAFTISINTNYLQRFKVPFIEIAYERLSTDALYGVIKEFVTRDGTDYGERDVPLEIKISEVLGQLKSGTAVIVFDPNLESCNILRSDDPALKS